MMPVACTPLERFDDSFDIARSVSQAGHWLKSELFNSRSVSAVKEHGSEIAPTLEDGLALALLRAREAVFEQVRYLGGPQIEQIIANLGQLLSLDSWDENDGLLRNASVRTMLRTIIALNEGAGQLTIARAGNLVSTWKLDNKVLRVEAFPNGTISWTILHPRGSQPRHQHSSNDTVEGLKTTLASL